MMTAGARNEAKDSTQPSKGFCLLGFAEGVPIDGSNACHPGSLSPDPEKKTV